MKFGHLNIRSILTGFEQFREFIISENFDFFAVTETWLNAGINNEICAIPSYNFIRLDREGRGGGLGIYVKVGIKFKIILKQSETTLEQLWLQTAILGTRYAIGVLYRPPKSNVLDAFDALENSLSMVLPNCDTILMTGDLNINLLGDNQSVSHFYNFIESFNLSQIIKEPTRYTNTTQTLIDIIITSDNECINEGRVINLHDVSDHCALACNINKLKSVNYFKSVTFRDFKNFDENIFFRQFHGVNWDNIYEMHDVNCMVQFLNENLIEVFDVTAPIRTVRVTKPPAPWLTFNVKEMMKLRDKAFKKFKETRSPTHWNYYKDLKNQVNYAIRREKKAYMEFVMAKNNTKITWQSLKSLKIINKGNKYDIPDNLLDLDAINTHFTNPLEMNKTPEQINFLQTYKQRNNNINASFKFSNVEKKHVIKYLNSIKSNSVGSDLVSLKMFQLVSFYLVDHITFILNFALSTSIFPDAWKQANVLPLAKISNPTEMGHLRPISILPMLSKLLELAMKTQISEYVFENNIIPMSQSGFRDQHSTTTALTTITDDLIKATDEGKVNCLVLLDYSKAFDTMDPNILCDKLSYYNFAESAVLLIRNYLLNRNQRVVYNSKSSNLRYIHLGVPQGSILGPLLFSIYISDFYKVVSHCNIHNYADDTQVYFSFDPDLSHLAVEKITNDLNRLVDISAAHNLKLNANKSVFMLFGSKQKREAIKQHIKINIKDNELPLATEAKNLGLWFDSDMRFSKHINHLCKTSYNILRQLYPHKHMLNSKTKLNICEALIISKVSYCDTIYGPALLKYDSNRLQKIQNSCFRFAFGIRKYDHINYKFNENKKLKLDQLRNMHTLTLVHKVLQSGKPTYLYKKLFRFEGVSTYNTRNKNTLVIPKHSTAMFKRCFTYNACKLYNSLPVNFQNYSLINFKKKLKSFLL